MVSLSENEINQVSGGSFFKHIKNRFSHGITWAEHHEDVVKAVVTVAVDLYNAI